MIIKKKWNDLSNPIEINYDHSSGTEIDIFEESGHVTDLKRYGDLQAINESSGQTQNIER